jgi:hypothetical protein
MRRDSPFRASGRTRYDSPMKETPPKSRSGKRAPKPPAGGAGSRRRGSRKSSGDEKNNTAFRFRLRGKDGAPLSMAEVRQGLLEAARELKAYDSYRARWVTVYLTLIDENGKEVVPAGGEITLHPYKSAAEEFGI